MLTYLLKEINWLQVTIISTIFFVLFWLFNEVSNSISFLNFTEIPLLARLHLVILNVIEGFIASSFVNQAIAFIASVLAGVHTTIFLKHFKQPASFSFKNGLHSNIGLIVTMIGFGCGACGGIMLTYLSFLTGAYTSMLADSNFISYLGTLLMVFSTYRLLKNLTDTNVCEVV